MAQRYREAACNLNQKGMSLYLEEYKRTNRLEKYRRANSRGKSWYLEKYKQANPKKERIDIWRSTDGQTPRRKKLIFGEVQTDKSHKGKSWYLEKYRRTNLKKERVDLWESNNMQSQSKKKRTNAYQLSQKGKSGSSNTNGSQIIIAGPSRD